MSSVTKSKLHANGPTPTNGTGYESGSSKDDASQPNDAAGRRETDLFTRAQAGDRGAFGQLAIACQDRLYNAIVRLVGDREEARELAQETFVKALSKIDTFRGESKPYTWMFRIGLNLALSHLRTVKRHRTFSLDRPTGRANPGGRSTQDQAATLTDRLAGRELSPADALDRRETAERVVTAMGAIDDEYRALLVMRDVEGMDYQLMADTLGLPLGTLKSRLFRARKALREELTKVMELNGENPQMTPR